MPMVKCPDCEKMISESATSCPNCGRPNSANAVANGIAVHEKKKVSILLGIGIFLVPFLFSWFTLKKGHTTLSRVLAFSWMGIILISFMSETPDQSSPLTATSETAPKKQSYPVNNESYSQVNSVVGCDSKFSDDKKSDIFNAQYKDHWFTWQGVVVLAESDEASLNVDRFGTQDIQVDFADSNAGYDLVKDSEITVRFLMKTAGGCYLPFSGDKAVIAN